MKTILMSHRELGEIIRPENMMEEVKKIVRLMVPFFDFSWVMTVYRDVVKLFEGEFVGYKKCNTKYHDFRHTEDCILEFARIMHGAFVQGHKFSIKNINLGLVSAMMHDTGYIQKAGDNKGTGAKYTKNHIKRSIDFTKRYFSIKGYAENDFIFCKNCLHCTGLDVKIYCISFNSAENELMGKILGVADLIGQMSDSNYLQKLPFLFEEFQEGGVTEFKTEFELFQKTPDFWEFTQERFKNELGNVDRFLKDHFRVRWGVNHDLDRLAIEFNINRLKYILKNHPEDYRFYLMIGGLPEDLPPRRVNSDHLAL